MRGLADISISENQYRIRSFSSNVFEKFNNGMQKVIKHFFQIKDLHHPDDTSVRVTAGDVNFVTNPEYVYVK